MILPIDEELATVFAVERDRLRDLPWSERLPAVLGEIRRLVRGAGRPPKSIPLKRPTQESASETARRRRAALGAPIVEAVARAHGVSVTSMKIGRGTRPVWIARAEAAWIMVRVLRLTSFEAAVALGCERSTVSGAAVKVDRLVAADEVLAARLRALAVGPAVKTREAA